MPTTTEYLSDEVLDALVESVLHSNRVFAPVLEHVKLSACLLSRCDDDGEPVESKSEPIKVKKVPADVRVFTKSDIDYVVVVDRYFFTNKPKEQVHGTLSRHLMRIEVTIGDDGAPKHKLSKFDVMDFVANIAANGAYDDSTKAMRDAFGNRLLSAADAIDSRLQKSQAAPETKRKTRVEEPIEDPEDASPPEEEDEEDEEDDPPRVHAGVAVPTRNRRAAS